MLVSFPCDWDEFWASYIHFPDRVRTVHFAMRHPIISFALVLVYLLQVCPQNVGSVEYKLEIETYGSDGIAGCYGPMQSTNVGICFKIRDNYIHISTRDGVLLSLFWKLGEQFHYMQSSQGAYFR